MAMYEKIVQLVDEATPGLVEIRRDFHKYAESGWEKKQVFLCMHPEYEVYFLWIKNICKER